MSCSAQTLLLAVRCTEHYKVPGGSLPPSVDNTGRTLHPGLGTGGAATAPAIRVSPQLGTVSSLPAERVLEARKPLFVCRARTPRETDEVVERVNADTVVSATGSPVVVPSDTLDDSRLAAVRDVYVGVTSRWLPEGNSP